MKGSKEERKYAWHPSSACSHFNFLCYRHDNKISHSSKRMTKVAMVLLFITLFGIGFFVTHTLLWVYRTKQSAPPIVVKGRPAIVTDVNAASLTTAARKESTLNNPVGMLNGQQVYLKVSTNPAR